VRRLLGGALTLFVASHAGSALADVLTVGPQGKYLAPWAGVGARALGAIKHK
jgi:hypothetical protein